MTLVVVTARAEKDIDSIVVWLRQHASLQIALDYDAAFTRAIKSLTSRPTRGSRRPQYGDDVRVIVISPYLIFYTLDASADLAHVLRILHERRNITRRLVNKQT